MTSILSIVEKYGFQPDHINAMAQDIVKKLKTTQGDFEWLDEDMMLEVDFVQTVNELAQKFSLTRAEVIVIAREAESQDFSSNKRQVEADDSAPVDMFVDSLEAKSDQGEASEKEEDSGFHVYSGDDEDDDDDEKPEQPRTKKKKRGDGKTLWKVLGIVLGGIVLVIVLAIIASLVMVPGGDEKKDGTPTRTTQPYSAQPSTQQQGTNRYGNNNVITQAVVQRDALPVTVQKNGYDIPPEDPSSSSTPVPTEYQSDTKKPMPVAKPAVTPKAVPQLIKREDLTEEGMIEKGKRTKRGSFNKSGAGVCTLVSKYNKKRHEFVYYIRKNGEYIPAYQTKGWDGKGVGLNKQTIAISSDESEGMVEVEEGKFLPAEIFSSCSVFLE